MIHEYRDELIRSTIVRVVRTFGLEIVVADEEMIGDDISKARILESAHMKAINLLADSMRSFEIQPSEQFTRFNLVEP